MPETTTLSRHVTLPILVLYGLGTTIGAGVFVLLGAVASGAGAATPIAFLVASLLAGATALAFAELSSRFPKAAGEAVYVNYLFGSPRLAQITGLAVATIGMISSATILSGFGIYAASLLGAPATLSALLALAVLVAVAGWGIRQSAWLAAGLACVEIGALAVVIGAGAEHLADPAIYVDIGAAFAGEGVWIGIASGAVVAFFAFIGFEDMVNVAEEVVDPVRTMPRAIIWTLAITLVLYLGLSIVALGGLGVAALGTSETPMADLFTAVTGLDSRYMIAIVLVAITNGALVQIIMASRVFYGLARQGWLPGFLGRIHPRTHTPLLALAVVGVTIAALTVLIPLEPLARATSTITLLVFLLINGGLLIAPRPPSGAAYFLAPRWIVALGTAGALTLVIFQIYRGLGAAVGGG
jgi:amino acid transporter